MKIQTKTLLSMTLVFVLSGIATGAALVGMEGAKNRFEHFLQTDQALLQAASDMYANGLQSGQALRNIVIDPTNATGHKNLEKANADFQESTRQALALVTGNAADRKVLEDLLALRRKQIEIQARIVAMAAPDQSSAISAISQEETPVWRTIRERLLEFIKVKRAAVEHSKAELGKFTQGMLVTALTLMVAALAIGSVVIVWLTRHLMSQLGGEPAYAKEVAGRIAGGDLALAVQVRAGDGDSMIAAMAQMAQGLRKLVGEVAEGAHTVADTSSQIARGNMDLSQRTEEQASTLEETASSMEELTSTVSQNAENARQASQLAVGASEVARKGGEVVGQVVSTMNGISESSRKIADIIGVIDGIAFQTNILALNAAVEAARAGEQGRGFAVVAAEVRNLAQRSAAAAKEIKTLIGDSVDKVDAGNKLVSAAGQTMDEIVGSVKKVSDLIAEIAAASREQSSGIEQVNTAVSQMEHVVQQNASLVEEATAATESMKGQADSLLQTVSRFKLAAAHASQQPLELTTVPMPASQPAHRAAARSATQPIPIKTRATPRLTSDFAPLNPAAGPRSGGNGEWKEM